MISTCLGWSAKLLTGEGRGPGELSETKKGRSSSGMPLEQAQDHTEATSDLGVGWSLSVDELLSPCTSKLVGGGGQGTRD